MQYFQDYMPENVCFGCGQNDQGLAIKSYWEGEEAVCYWQPQEHHHGWPKLLNGGIMATIVDCHCMATAIADAYQREERALDSMPVYRYATGTLTIKYLKPTPIATEIKLIANVLERKGKKTVMRCDVVAAGEVTATAEVIAIRVYDSSDQEKTNNSFV